MRKIALVEFFGKSSLLIRLEHEADGTNVYEKHPISEAQYAAVGGAVTIRNHSGVMGVLVLSITDFHGAPAQTAI